jgi:hypothetical protein
MDHNNDNAVFWDDKGFYTVRWEETGNNDIPHKKYIYEPKPKNDLQEQLNNEWGKARRLRDFLAINGYSDITRNVYDNILRKMDEIGL